MSPYRRRIPALVLILACFGLHAAENANLVPFDVTYQLYIKDVSQGETDVTLQQHGPDTWRYRSHTHPTRLASWFRDDTVREESRFTVNDGRLVPLAFEYTRNQNGKSRHVTLKFEWERDRVLNSVGDDTWTMPVPLGALDKMLVNLALMLDLRRGKTVAEYPVADGGILKSYRFEITGKERIETPAGTFDTVRVKRSKEDHQPTYLWCAETLAWLPVKIERRLSHDMRYTSELKKFSESLREWNETEEQHGE